MLVKLMVEAEEESTTDLHLVHSVELYDLVAWLTRFGRRQLVLYLTNLGLLDLLRLKIQ